MYSRAPRLFGELAVARGDGRYAKLMKSIARTNLLIIDDWGLSVLTEPERRDLLEILEDRYDVQSTIVAGQLPVEHWHEAIGNPTLADAILDRLVHNAYKIDLKGESMRKKKKKPATTLTQRKSSFPHATVRVISFRISALSVEITYTLEYYKKAGQVLPSRIQHNRYSRFFMFFPVTPAYRVFCICLPARTVAGSTLHALSAAVCLSLKKTLNACAAAVLQCKRARFPCQTDNSERTPSEGESRVFL